jgi:hypothetical protein
MLDDVGLSLSLLTSCNIVGWPPAWPRLNRPSHKHSEMLLLMLLINHHFLKHENSHVVKVRTVRTSGVLITEMDE